MHAALGRNELVPIALRNRWASDVRRRAHFNLIQARETARVCEILDQSAVANIVLKGLPLALRIYGSFSLKRSSDIDVLVAPEDAVEAVGRLGDYGYVSQRTGKSVGSRQILSLMRHAKEITLSNANGAVIDLHWRLMDEPHLLDGIRPFENARTFAFANLCEIRILGQADEFAYLCAHGAHSNWSRMKWLVDIGAFLTDLSHDDQMSLYGHAEKLNVGPAVIQAFGLRELFWRHTVPPALRTDLESFAAQGLLAYACERMQQPYTAPSFLASVHRMRDQIEIQGALFGNRRMAVFQAFKSLVSQSDVLAVPLPPWLDWLYYLVRPLTWLGRPRRKRVEAIK